MPPPCNPLNMPLWALPGLSLYVACSQHGHNTVVYPIKLLAAKYGHHHRLREMLPRFKCPQGGQPPAKVMLCEKPYNLNNRIEQDHRRIKQRLRPMLGLKSLLTAVVVIAGIELAEKIKKGQFKIGKLGGNAATMPEIWQAALAA